jgi:hypothetical protein
MNRLRIARPVTVAWPLRGRTGLTIIAATAMRTSNSSRSWHPASQALARTKIAAAIGPPTVFV